MMDGSLATLAEKLMDRIFFDSFVHRRADKPTAYQEGRSLPEVRPHWFASNASFADRTAVGILEQVMNACKLVLPQDWKMRSKRRLADLKNAKKREAVLDSARRWFRSNDISLRAITDDGVFNSFSTAMNSDLNLTSSRHGVSRKWYDFLRPDLPSLSAYLSVGRQMAWEKACASHLNRLLANIEGDTGSGTSPIDLVVHDPDNGGDHRIKAFKDGLPVSEIDPEFIQEALSFADEDVKAVDAPGLAGTDLSAEGAEQVIAQELQRIALKIDTAFGEAIESWQPCYDDNGYILAAHPLIRTAQFAQSREFDMQTPTLTVSQTSQLSDQDAVDRFLQQVILDVSAQQWAGGLPADTAGIMMTPTFNLGGAHFNSMYATDNSLLYSILEMQQTQQNMMAFAVAKQNWEASAPMLEWCRQELIKQGRATDLLDDRLELYNNALQAAYFNMMLCLMHLGSVNALKGAIIQPHNLPVEGFSMGTQLNTSNGMFIMDDENALWEDRLGGI